MSCGCVQYLQQVSHQRDDFGHHFGEEALYYGYRQQERRLSSESKAGAVPFVVGPYELAEWRPTQSIHCLCAGFKIQI